jgi:hypothetical protein
MSDFFKLLKLFFWRLGQVFTGTDEVIATVTLVSATDGEIMGHIMASPGTKITERELQLSHNTPNGFIPIAYYFGRPKTRKIKTPFRIFESDTIYILFAAHAPEEMFLTDTLR